MAYTTDTLDQQERDQLMQELSKTLFKAGMWCACMAMAFSAGVFTTLHLMGKL